MISRYFALSFFVGCAVSALAAEVNVSQYVQKGLVTCWDGQTSAPTTEGWTDISGQYTWTFTDKQSKIVFNDDSVTFPARTDAYGTLNKASTTATFGNGKGGTVEVVMKTTQASGCMLQTPASIGATYYFTGDQFAGGSENVATWNINGFKDGVVHTLSVSYNDADKPSPQKAWGDGTALPSFGSNNYIGTTGEYSTLGGRNAHNNTAFSGTIYAIRIYNRVLSAGELAVNAALDRVRYLEDQDPATFVWPEGVRWNDSTQKVECRVMFDSSNANLGTVTSQLGGTGVPSNIHWINMNESTAANLPSGTAAVGSGASFIRWTGVLTGIADIYATTIAVPDVTEPRPLTALFQADGAPIPPDPHGGDDYATIAAAITAAEAGDTVELAEGKFHLSESIEITKAITLKGAGMNRTVFKPTKNGFRAFHLNHKDAVIEGLQANGFKVKGGRYQYGAGFYIEAGKAINCRASGNKGTDYYDHGVGFYLTGANSVATNCVSDHNVHSTSVSGTGFYLTSYAKIWNCLAYDNSVNGSSVLSASIHLANSGSVYSSTVVGSVNDGGIYINGGGLVTNCVSALNSNYPAHLAGPDAPDIGLSAYSLTNSVRCCVTGRHAEFRDAANGDYRLRPALAALTNAGYSPYDPTEDALDFVADDTHAFTNEVITLTAVQTGSYAGKTLSWEVKDAHNTTYPVSGANPVTVSLPTQGSYTVTLTAEGETPCVRADYLYIRNRTNELAATGITDALPAAVDAMIDGETLILGEGTYPTTRAIYMTNDVTIVGQGWDKTVVSKTGSRGVFIMSAEKAHLTGCTVTGGAASDYYNITGSGVRITGRGGKVSWCKITGNKHSAYYTDGVGIGMESVNSWVTHCIISNNLASTTADKGGGVHMKYGLLENSLIVNNTAKYGGGLHVDGGNGKIRNCTIAKNTAGVNGGGVCGYRPYGNYVFTDCVIAENTADSDTGASGAGKPNWSTTEAGQTFNASSFVNCAIGSPSTVLGSTSISVNAPFVDSAHDDFHLDKACAAVDGGASYDGLADDDLDGNDRVSGDAVDMGCYEADMAMTDCSFEISPTIGFTSVPLTCTPTVINPPAGKTLIYTWTFTDGNGVDTVFEGQNPDVLIAAGGVYTVKLEIFTSDDLETPIASNTRSNLVRLACKKVYAVGGGVNPTMAEPFDTWEKAHTNLNELATYLIDGCEVELGEGEFMVTNHLVLAGNLQYHGSGIDRTVIRCSDCRAFYLNDKDALVENLTVTNGNCKPYVVTGGYDEPGLGILVGASGGTVRDCRVTGCVNSTFYNKGAIAVIGANGYVTHCIVDHNRATTGNESLAGLYLSAGHIDNCLVYSNRSNSAAGLAANGNNLTVSNCTFVANEGLSSGSGGLHYMFSASNPVGVELVNLVFAGNKGVVRALEANSQGQYDLNELDFRWTGGMNFGTAENAMAHFRPCVKNCLFLFAEPEMTVGIDCLNCDPKFKDAAALDFRPTLFPTAERSPLVNAGAYSPWMDTAIDLDGNKRVKHVNAKGVGFVDIGCYETKFLPQGTSLILR